MDVYPQRIVSLCSGVGWLDEGLRLGLEWFGFVSRVVAYVERDAYAASVLLARMVESSLEYAPISDSIEDIGEQFCGHVDWIVAGFPCQPWSHAGSQQGIADERWLWPDIADCIRRVGPRGVFLENVPGIVSGGGLEHVLLSLAEMGFDAEWGCLTASSVGASHKRERVFILANTNCLRWNQEQRAAAKTSHTVSNGDSETVDNTNRKTQCEIRRPDERHSEQRGGKCLSGNGRESVGNAEVIGEREPDNEASPIARKRTWETTCGTSHAMGDSQRKRSQGGRLAITQRRDIAGTPVADRGIFAPGPVGNWRDIPEYLWPAIKSGFCELVDGQPLVVDESRADQLRCAGNGCVAIQAAAVFVELMRRMQCRQR